MEEKKLVPKRRFKGFNKNLNKEIFKNLGSFGKTYSFSRSREGDGIYHHIHYGDIHTKNFGIIHEDTEVPAITEMNNFETVKKGDIVIADASEDYNDLGKVVVIGELKKKKVIAGLHTFKFTPNSKLLSEYFLYYSQTNYYRKFSAKIGTGISVFGISKENLSKLNLNLPSLDEQQKIGKFFRVLDERIANQERKIAKVKALKEAYLIEMFPKEGETVPKRRFRGFNDNWIEKSIGDMYRVSTGYPFSSKDFKLKGLYKVITNKNIQDQDRKMEKNYSYVNNLGNLIIESYRLIGQNVLVSMDGEVGITGRFSDEKALLAQRVARIEGDNLEFLYQFTKRKQFIRDMDNISVGNIIKHISLNQIRDYIIKVPKQIEEQQKIAAFFKNLDDQIEAEEAKLEKLKQMKEAYLEEMFV